MDGSIVYSRAKRHAIRREATLRDSSGRPSDVDIINVAVSGCAFRCEAKRRVGEHITLGLPGIGVIEARVVHVAGLRHGCVFRQSISADQISALKSVTTLARGRFAPPPPLRSKWMGPEESDVRHSDPAGWRKLLGKVRLASAIKMTSA